MTSAVRQECTIKFLQRFAKVACSNRLVILRSAMPMERSEGWLKVARFNVVSERVKA